MHNCFLKNAQIFVKFDVLYFLLRICLENLGVPQQLFGVVNEITSK